MKKPFKTFLLGYVFINSLWWCLFVNCLHITLMILCHMGLFMILEICVNWSLCNSFCEGYCWHLVNPLNVGSHKKWSLVSATGQETGQSGIIYWISLFVTSFVLKAVIVALCIMLTTLWETLDHHTLKAVYGKSYILFLLVFQQFSHVLWHVWRGSGFVKSGTISIRSFWWSKLVTLSVWVQASLILSFPSWDCSWEACIDAQSLDSDI